MRNHIQKENPKPNTKTTCIVVSWWLPGGFLVVAWWLPDGCIFDGFVLACRLLGGFLVVAWWLPGGSLVVA